MATAKKASAPKQNTRVTASAKPAPPKSATAKKATPAAGRAVSKPASAPKKGSPKPVKSAPATKAQSAKSPPAKAPAARPAAKPAAKAAPAKAPAKQAAAKSPTPVVRPAPVKAIEKKVAVAPAAGPSLPAPVKGEKDGVKFTKDFDAKFLLTQRALLFTEREALAGQALRLEDEANALIEEQEMGDVQFDDEGGEGDTMVVERERDLTLSAQARQTIVDIETALGRLTTGRYGYSTESGRPIPRERLEAIPWATMLVEEKVGGIGRR
jgi:RNA polymerase-binding transcription factor DksA